MLKWWNAPPKTDAAKKRSEKQMAKMRWDTMRARDQRNATARDAVLWAAAARRDQPKPSTWDPHVPTGRASAGPVRTLSADEILAEYTKDVGTDEG